MSTTAGYRLGFETQREERGPESVPVEGTLPDWLAGRYVQNGPGRFEVGGRRLRHWFDPLAMLRAVSFSDGEATYVNRYVRSRDYEFARRRGQVRAALPGTPADRPVWTRVRQALTGVVQDNPSIGVLRVNGEYVAVTESPVGFAFDPETLETTGEVPLTAGLDADLTLGHAHYDPDRSATVNLAVSYGEASAYTLFERPDGRLGADPVARLEFEDPPYVHSFGLTDRYAVVPDAPFGIDTSALLWGAVTGGTFLDAFGAWDRPGRFHVIDRETGDVVASPRAEPFFIYHCANCYERPTDDGTELVLDAVAYPDERAVTGLTLENLRRADPDLPTGDLVRFRLPLEGGTATRERIHGGQVEFPVVDYPGVAGRRHRYVWLAETGDADASLPVAIAKVDVETGDVRRWSEPGTYPGEPIFVGRPGGDAEDDGVLVASVLDARADPGGVEDDASADAGDPPTPTADGGTGTAPTGDDGGAGPTPGHGGDGAGGDGGTFVVVLDAADLSERARVHLPHRLPYGFHGQFYGFEEPVRSMP